MLARLGEVVYWAGCGLAVIWIGMGLYASFDREHPRWEDFALAGGGAVLIWLIGRATRYVLAGK